MAARKKKTTTMKNASTTPLIASTTPMVAASVLSSVYLEVTGEGKVRVTILDSETRETIYGLATGGDPADAAANELPLELVVRYASNPGILLSNCPGGPGGSTSPDTCCPC